MTWGDLKATLEQKGFRDTDEIRLIDLDFSDDARDLAWRTGEQIQVGTVNGQGTVFNLVAMGQIPVKS